MKKSSIYMVAMAFSPFAVHAEEPDSLKTEQLQEVIVEGNAQNLSATKSTYLPSTKVKTAAVDAVDLLRRMAIPELNVSATGSDVKTIAGQDVSIFINYVQASGQDVMGLKTTDVKRVEYLDYPADPRFRGVPHAVNIIVQEYEWGGYTKLRDRQWVLQGVSNQGELYSKFAYKKMVYDVYGSWEYINNKDIGTSSYSTYHLPKGEINRDQKWLNSKREALYFPVSFRASYNTQKMQIINTVGFTFSDMFTCMEHSGLTFSDAPERNYEATSLRPNVNRTLAWNGDYYFMLPKDWSIGAYPQFTYGRNGSWSNYSTTIPDEVPILNNAKENVYYGRLDLNIGKRVGQHHTFRLELNGSLGKNEVNYSGSTTYNSVFHHDFWGVGPAYNLNLDRVSLSTDFGVAVEYQKTNGVKYTDTYPYFHLNGKWAPNSRNSFGIWLQYATNSPGQSDRTSNVLQSNELMYITGNPDLHNARHVTVNLNYTFVPCNLFNLSAYAQYFGLYDRVVSKYEQYADGNALLHSYFNSGDFTTAAAGLNATLRLFDNSLIIQASPRYTHSNSSGYLKAHLNAVTFSVYAQYYLRSFNFSAAYNTRSKYMSSSSATRTTSRGQYHIAAGWSNKDWSVSVLAVNFLRHKASTSWSDMNSPLYSTREVFFNGNASAAIGMTVVYTIGYGKPIQRGNELQGISGAGSAIL